MMLDIVIDVIIALAAAIIAIFLIIIAINVVLVLKLRSIIPPSPQQRRAMTTRNRSEHTA